MRRLEAVARIAAVAGGVLAASCGYDPQEELRDLQERVDRINDERVDESPRSAIVTDAVDALDNRSSDYGYAERTGDADEGG